MGTKKTNYFKELIKEFDLFLALIFGAVGSLLFFYLDGINAFSKLSLTSKWTYFLRDAAVIAFLAVLLCLVIVFVFNTFRKKVTIYDFLLVSVESFGIVSLIQEAAKETLAASNLAFWIVFVVIGLLLLVARYAFVDRQEKATVGQKRYFAALAYRYNFLIIGAIGLLIGLLLGGLGQANGINAVISSVLPSWSTLSQATRFGYLAGAFGGVLLFVWFVTILNGGHTKVSALDAVLVTLQIAFVSAGVYFGPSYPKYNVTTFLAWIFINVAMFITVMLRSLCVNSEIALNRKKSSTFVYYHGIAAKFSLPLMALIGVGLGAGLIYIDHMGLANMFKHAHWMAASIAVIIAIVALGALAVMALIRKQLTAKHTVLLDWLLFVAASAAVTLIAALFIDYSVLKLILLLILFAVVIAFVVIRILHVVPEEVEAENGYYCCHVDVENNAYVYTSIPMTVVSETRREEKKEAVTETVAPAEPAAEPEAVEEEDAEELPEKNSNEFTVRYKKSFYSKLALSSDEVKGYYSDVKNHMLAYKVRDRLSWNFDSYNAGRTKLARIAIRGKTLVIYFALDPKGYEGSKYHVRDASESKKYQETPTMLKVRSSRGVKYACELIDAMMGLYDIRLKKTYEPSDYKPEAKTFEELVAEGWIRDMLAEEQK